MEITIAQFDILFQLVPGGTDKEHEKHYAIWRYMWAEI